MNFDVKIILLFWIVALVVTLQIKKGSIYSYVDQYLSAWEQRTVFKANIKSFVSLKKNDAPISLINLRKITDFFHSPNDEHRLNPTYELDKHESNIKEVNKKNENIFKILQKFNRLNLVVPVGEEHMYYAAIHSKSCRLTALGQHYWKLAKNNYI